MSDDQNPSVEKRLRELKSLHDEGVISDDEYIELRQPLIDQLAVLPSQADTGPPESLLSREDERADKRWALFIVLGVIAVLVVVAAIVANLVDRNSTTVHEGAQRLAESMGIPHCDTTQVVEYVVDGTASSTDITIQNAEGDTEVLSDMRLPWSRLLGPMECGRFPYIAAQNQDTQDRTSSVRCRIIVDGHVAEEDTESTGGIALCSGQLR